MDPPSGGDGRPGREPEPLQAIECREVVKHLGGNPVLNGLTCQVPAGRVTAIVGPAGSGKTTLLHHFVGLMSPDGGEVRVGGANLADLDPGQLLALRRRIGTVFQEGALFSGMTIYDNVAFPLRRVARLPEAEVREAVSALLAGGDLADCARLRPDQVSVGIRKRAAIARALALQPEILLVDDPGDSWGAMWDALFYSRLWNLGEELRATAVIVSHELQGVIDVADHLVVVNHGRVVEAGARDRIEASQEPLVKHLLERARLGPPPA